MAIHVDMESQGKLLERQREKTIHKRFKFFKIAVCVIAGIIVVTTIVNVTANVKKINKVDAQYTALNDDYTKLKNAVSQNMASVEQSEKEEGSVSENKIDRQMYSAQEAGERVCELQLMAYNQELLLTEDKQELKDLTGSTDLWYGLKLDPTVNKITWEFLTDYDHTDVYDCVWGCYTDDYKYLLCLVFGTYDGENDKFTITSMYNTDFGAMYESDGAIDNNTVSGNSVGDDVSDAVDELLNSDVLDDSEEDATNTDAEFTDDAAESSETNTEDQSNNTF